MSTSAPRLDSGPAPLARNAAVVSLATVASRLFGLLREQTFAYLFGAGLATDAFVAAFRIPNLLRDLFAEGVLGVAFVPVFTDSLTKKGKVEAFRVANLCASGLVVAVSAVVIVGIVASPWIVHLIAPGFEKIPGKMELTALLTRIMFPFLLFIALAALWMGMANSLGSFAIPAAAPILFNLGMIVAGFTLGSLFAEPVVAMALGVLVGGFGQWAIQWPVVHRHGFRPAWELSFRDPELRRILVLMVPAVIALASTQVNIFVNTLVASLLPQGSVSYLNYSFRLMHFPLGAFGIAVATVTLPLVSRLAAQGDRTGMLAAVTSSLRLVFFLTIPATVFLLVAGKPLVALLYQYGRFTRADTLATASALWFYALGLVFYASVRVLAQTFYAARLPKIPVAIGALAVAFNIGLNLVLMQPLGFRGLALATSASAALNVCGLFYFAHFRLGALPWGTMGAGASRVLAAALLAGLIGWGTPRLFPYFSAAHTVIGRFITVAILLSLFSLTYGLAGKLLRIPEWQQVSGLFLRLFRKQ